MPDRTPTRDLVQAYRLGDQDAARELHQRFVGLLYRYAKGRVSSKDRRAMDLSGMVQSVFRVFFQWVRKPGTSINDTAHAGNMLKGMVKRRVINAAKRPDRPPPLDFDIPDPAPGQWDKYQERLDEIERFLAAWDEHKQAAVRLRLEGHTIAQIANRVDTTPGRVKHILKRFRDEFGRRRQKTGPE